MFIRNFLIFGIVAVAISSTAVATDHPGTSVISNQNRFAINRHNDAHYNGAIVNVWAENNHISQDWGIRSDNTIHSHTNSNFCLNLHGNTLSNGATINLWECNGHNSQKWIRVGSTLRPVGNTNFCLNLHNYNNSNGATINLWECNGHASQNWGIVTQPMF